jgi:hypothetical protein
MSDGKTERDQEVSPRSSDPAVHDEHPTEPAEGARHPGETEGRDVREHPSEPAEGPRDDSQG